MAKKNQNKKNKLEVKINGMHCESCEVLLEKRLKKINGVKNVDVNYSRGSAILEYEKNKPSIEQIREIVKTAGYSLLSEETEEKVSTHARVIEIISALIMVFFIFLILRSLNIFDSIGVSDNMSLGFVFLIGIIAAFSSCLAVTGGLLVSITAKYSELHPNLKGFNKFKPHLYFNTGRIIGYTIFGFLIGYFGSLFTMSTTISGVLTILASIVMIILGLDLLGIFPKLTRFLRPSMPKIVSHKIIQKADEEPSRSTPFFLGTGSFFLPCGFTIALQLYVLSKGDPILGALTMLAFSLGTLPGLLSLGAFSSFLKGTLKRYFFTIVGIVVIILGIITIQNGFVLAGAAGVSANTINSNIQSNNNIVYGNSNGNDNTQISVIDKNVRVENGVQIVEMKIDRYSYSPAEFTIVKDMPVEFRIDAKNAAGCARVITLPKLGITKSLSTSQINIIEFTPDKIGNIEFMCTMAMTTRGAKFIVVDNNNQNTQSQTATITTTSNNENKIVYQEKQSNYIQGGGCPMMEGSY